MDQIWPIVINWFKVDVSILSVCKYWYELITNTYQYQAMNNYCKQIITLLHTDKTKYDPLYYARELYRIELYTEFQNYEFYIPTLIKQYSDWDDDYITTVELSKLPIRLKLFIKKYITNPKLPNKLYPVELINNLQNKCCNNVRELLINGLPITNYISLVPLFYSIHYKKTIHDSYYYNVLCYVNLIDPDLSESYADEDERYIVITVPFNGLENIEQHYIELISCLSDMEKRNLSAETESLMTCFKLLETRYAPYF